MRIACGTTHSGLTTIVSCLLLRWPILGRNRFNHRRLLVAVHDSFGNLPVAAAFLNNRHASNYRLCFNTFVKVGAHGFIQASREEVASDLIASCLDYPSLGLSLASEHCLGLAHLGQLSFTFLDVHLHVIVDVVFKVQTDGLFLHCAVQRLVSLVLVHRIENSSHLIRNLG